MPSYARSRLEATIVREVADILEFEVKDPALRTLSPTVMGARLSPTGEEATVAVAVDGGEEVQDQVLAALRHDQGFIRAQLARRLAVRRVPALRFVIVRPLRGETGG
ncbi:MAG: 30S ribosome-binding factor RbfA [Candidatus Bipolaricaulota bacterium]|nr:30S ribosome-binding factor RbfA [Candidatus Bipolaricaulota bacterium]